MLRISLKDGEKVVINGAVIVSRGRSSLTLENDVSLLRGKDIMSPEQAITPARRLYFVTMLAYLEPDKIAEHQETILAHLQDLIGVVETPEAKSLCASYAGKVSLGDFYRALAVSRDLIVYENSIFERLSAETVTG